MSETATTPAPAPAGPAQDGEPAAPEPGVRLPVAVLAVVAAVVVALLVVALAVRLDGDRLPSGPPREPPEAPAAATRFGVTGRQVTLDEFTATLAGPPFTCDTAVQPTPTGIAQLAQCTTPVHEDYDGSGSSWVAATGVALIDGPTLSPDLRTATSDVFDLFVSALYTREDRATLAKRSDGPAQVSAPSGAAWTQQADVRVEREGLPTPYDRLVVIVVRLQGGQHVAFFSDFPHDGSKQALQAVVDSVGTLEAQR